MPSKNFNKIFLANQGAGTKKSHSRLAPYFPGDLRPLVLLFLLIQWGWADSAMASSPLEPDPRTISWSTVQRLALEAGLFPPLYQPVSQQELAELLENIKSVSAEDSSSVLADGRERASIAALEARYGWPKVDDPKRVRASGRLLLGFFELGDPVAGEAGLPFAPGWSAALEPSLAWTRSSVWAAITPRWRGRLHTGGVDFDGDPAATDPLTWPGWSIPTGKAQVRSARLSPGDWKLDLPQAMVGVQLGNWALNGGWAPRKTGVGVHGALGMDLGGKSFPAVTLRRTRPFAWRGPIRRLGPHDLLLRVGSLSERKVRYNTEWGPRSMETRPWFFQWLLGWEVTRWFRFSAEHTVMAASPDGSLWPDLLQINFPIVGTTWREAASGPVTDRIFNVQFEFRWVRAPWPILPRDAGRLYWQYGGTDFLPSGPGGVIPQISAPASVAGFELFSPVWDLGLEYAELEHPLVMWYSNGGFPEGYSHNGWLLGYSLGGEGESVTGQVRYRPPGSGLETSLRVRRATWGMEHLTRGTGLQKSVAWSCRSLGQDHLNGTSRWWWEFSVEWLREGADPGAFRPDNPFTTAVQRDWWKVLCKLSLN